MDFEKIFKDINIKQEDNICLTVDLLNFINIDKNVDLKKISLHLVGFLKEYFSNGGSLIIPAFNWDFCKTNFYHKKYSKSKVGAFSNIVLNDKSFSRSDHAIYSFMVYGLLKDELLNNKCVDAFSKNSFIAEIIEKKFKHVLFTKDLRDGYFAVHYSEQYIGVDYRYIKTFEGDYVDQDNNKLKRSFSMFVRKDESKKWLIKKTNRKVNTVICDSFEKKLSVQNAYNYYNINSIPIHVIDLNKANKLLIDSLKNNKCLIFPRYK